MDFLLDGSDRSVRIWDAKTAAWQCTLKGHKQALEAADLSPTGQILASASSDGCVTNSCKPGVDFFVK